MAVRYGVHDVAVPGGSLRVGSWETDGPRERVVLAVHGITATHRTWPALADVLPPGTLLLAPDLRGRGRSGSLPGPYGLAQHADDCARVLTELAGGHCDLAVGHSMGGFVVVMLAARHPGCVTTLLLVDGGVPLVLPEGIDLEAARDAGLGAAAARLTMTFADRDEYRAFWQVHPAFRDAWTPLVADYVDYDLDPDGPPWRSSVSLAAVSADFAEQFEGGPVDRAWSAVAAPVTLLRAPRGLQDEPGGLYAPERLDEWASRPRDFSWREVAGVNHYTITLAANGAREIADEIGRVHSPGTNRFSE